MVKTIGSLSQNGFSRVPDEKDNFMLKNSKNWILTLAFWG